MPPSFDDDDIARAVANAHALAAGRRYQQDGRAHIVAIGEGGRRITGEVRGTAPAPYRQDIQAHPRSYGGTWFASSCTCPVRSNCKHVAAVLFQLLADEGSAPRPRLTPELGFWLEGLEHVIKRGPSEQPALAPRYQLFI